ncbi:uncharacterized protein STEHIDRAFT_169442 [Stereum hirsutum FP-91666 SS1]|uniref:uncharacterized protein n=1 Tax=Stereum hirsutum (strain FP-91666) TaxID=721885 RepID=UPI0004449402|nr:uncharacterized protein STEHIDRAFT_169442 [Stereum hirsutum FP-91666 SS1]EIM85553.1 hypothetical protein STEHIDRAFT_169442 [Stereum hirsutum FP-91666 SS1]
MFALLFATFLAAVVLLSLRIPSVWLSLIAHDEAMDAHELGLALVATRNPFRESGPPACMAKLIMLRHKLNQTTARKRRPSNTMVVRQAPRLHAHSLPHVQPRQRPPVPWVRIPRNFGKQHH